MAGCPPIEHGTITIPRVRALPESPNMAHGTPPVLEYAAQLRGRARNLPQNVPALVGRLLVCALIEARSCQRFKLLVDRMGEGHELHAFYKELFTVEARHFREFVDLAHAEACGCRPVPEKLADELVKRGLRIPMRLTKRVRSALHPTD